MPIGKIIVANEETREVIGEVSGNLMMKAEREGTFNYEYKKRDESNKPWSSMKYLDTLAHIKLIDIDSPKLKSYLPVEFKGVLGGNLFNIYSIYLHGLKLDGDKALYGDVDIGKFEYFPLFADMPKRDKVTGIFEWPLIQTRELSGLIPLVDKNRRMLLEDICFGEARLVSETTHRESFYYGDSGPIISPATEKIIEINRGQFRELANPIEEKLKEILVSKIDWLYFLT